MIADRVFANSKGWDGPLDSIAKTGDKKLVAQQTTGRKYNNLLKYAGVKVDVPAGNELMQLTADSNKKITIESAKVYEGYVPDVSGLGLKDAVYLLEKEGMQVQVKGKGKVQLQSVAPGSRIYKGQKIILQLSKWRY